MINRKDFLKLLVVAPLVPMAVKLAPKEPVEQAVEQVTSGVIYKANELVNCTITYTATCATSAPFEADYNFQLENGEWAEFSPRTD